MTSRYLAVLASLGMALLPLSAAFPQIRIGVITSETGPMSLIGIPQSQSIALLPQEVAGQTVQYLRLDDRSDPSISVANFKKLVGEERVDAVIGPSGTPNAMALVPFDAVLVDYQDSHWERTMRMYNPPPTLAERSESTWVNLA